MNAHAHFIPAARLPLLICALSLLLAGGCISLHAPPVELSMQDRARVKGLFAEIDEQNRSGERSDDWLRDAYREVHLKNLRDVPAEEFGRYRRFARSGDAYVIVHPGYFPFFDVWDIPRPPYDYAAGMPKANLVDRVTAGIPAGDIVYRTAREQERIVRDFIEYMAAEGRLVVLVLPRDYRSHVTYGAVPGYDEYARYLNEMSNGAENIVYIESAAYDRGQLLPEDLDVLIRFLRASGARSVMVGGGFIGKCQSGFTQTLADVMLPGFLFTVPELTQFAPADMKRDKVNILKDDGRISREQLYQYFRTFAYDEVTEEWLPWKTLPFYDIEGYR